MFFCQNPPFNNSPWKYPNPTSLSSKNLTHAYNQLGAFSCGHVFWHSNCSFPRSLTLSTLSVFLCPNSLVSSSSLSLNIDNQYPWSLCKTFFLSQQPVFMSCALPEMVVLVAFCSSAADDEDSMSEMGCCNMKTRRAWRARDADKSGGGCGRRRGEISQRSVVRICCWNPIWATKPTCSDTLQHFSKRLTIMWFVGKKRRDDPRLGLVQFERDFLLPIAFHLF